MRTVSQLRSPLARARAPHRHLWARAVGLVLLTAGAAACSSDGDATSDLPAVDPEAPVVTITSPARGAYVGEVSQVTVSGKVSDQGGAQLRSLTLNGAPIPVDAAGNFSAVVPISPTGTQLFHVVATDLQGKVGEVTQALSAGPLADTGQRLVGGITQRLSLAQLDAIADLMELAQLDADGAHLQPLNPVIDVGAGCALRAAASISALDIQAADVQLTPTSHGVQMSADWTGVTIPMVAQYALACVTGQSSFSITADRMHLSGRYVIAVKNGRFDVKLEQPQVTFTGLHLNAPGVPPQILSLLDLGNALGPILTLVINLLESPALNDLLGTITGVTQIPLPALTSILDFDILAGGTVTSAAAALLTFDPRLGRQGAPRTQFVQVPNLIGPVLDQVDDLVALADDTVNSLLASVASNGPLQIPLTPELANLIDQASVDEILPISIRADGTLELVVPEVTFDVDFANGARAVVAVNGIFGVAVAQEANGAVHLTVGNAQKSIDILSSSLPLTQAQLKALTELITNELRMLADRLIQTLPVPNGNGLPLQDLRARGHGGYVIVSGRP